MRAIAYDPAAWAIAIGIAGAVYALLYLARNAVVRRLEAFAQATETCLDDLAIKVLRATHPVFLALMAVYAGCQWLALPDRTAALVTRLAIGALLLQAARWGDVGVRDCLRDYRDRRSAQDAASTTSTAARSVWAPEMPQPLASTAAIAM